MVELIFNIAKITLNVKYLNNQVKDRDWKSRLKNSKHDPTIYCL